MENRFFSLIVVPDSGHEVRSSSFNFMFVFYLLGFIVVTFITCAFFITGYYIKLTQEKDYKFAVSTRHRLLNQVASSNKKLSAISAHLLKIQRNDLAYRLYAYMDVLDKDMYQAGIGGHNIVDTSVFAGLRDHLKTDMSDLALEIKKLESRVNIQSKSLDEIMLQVEKNQYDFNHTPLILPCHSYKVTSGYGWRINPVTGRRQFHDAVDLGGSRWDDIYATADGVVISAKRQGALGRCVKIRHNQEFETLYGHLEQILVKEGQKVKRNEIIGKMGSSGRVTGIHTHYSITSYKKKVNPLKYFTE